MFNNNVITCKPGIHNSFQMCNIKNSAVGAQSQICSETWVYLFLLAIYLMAIQFIYFIKTLDNNGKTKH